MERDWDPDRKKSGGFGIGQRSMFWLSEGFKGAWGWVLLTKDAWPCVTVNSCGLITKLKHNGQAKIQDGV